jgi:hypothetical protein
LRVELDLAREPGRRLAGVVDGADVEGELARGAAVGQRLVRAADVADELDLKAQRGDLAGALVDLLHARGGEQERERGEVGLRGHSRRGHAHGAPQYLVVIRPSVTA